MENVPRALKGTIQQKPGCHWCVPAVLVMNKEQKMGPCPDGHCGATASNGSFTLGFTATPPKCSIAHPVALGLAIQDGQWCQQGHSLGNTSSRTPKSLAVSIPEDCGSDPAGEAKVPAKLPEDQLLDWSCSGHTGRNNRAIYP